jgi:hypothetical protein
MPALLVATETDTTDMMTTGPSTGIRDSTMTTDTMTTDTMTTDTMSTGIRDTIAGSAEPITARARRHPLAVVVGLVMLSTLVLVALAVVALTDQGDDEATEATETIAATRPARSYQRARSMCRSGRRWITRGRPGEEPAGVPSGHRSICRPR